MERKQAVLALPLDGTDTPGYGEALFACQDLQKQAGGQNYKENNHKQCFKFDLFVIKIIFLICGPGFRIPDLWSRF